jgi:hypothetical protein
MSSFSVRDENTFNLVKALMKRDAFIHLDPVLIGDFDAEMDSAKDIIKHFPRKYCLVYSYNARINKPDEINAILSFCMDHNLIPVSVGGYQKWIHRHLDLNPFEVLLAIKHADYVITDTFHGTIFSAKYADRFGVIIRDSNRNKLGDLIKRLELSKHQIYNPNDIGKIYEAIKEKDAIDLILAEQRKKSLKYLRSNI